MAGPDLAEESEECEATVDFSTNYQGIWASTMGFHGIWIMGFFVELASGNLLHSELERSTIFHGKIHYFNGHFQ